MAAESSAGPLAGARRGAPPAGAGQGESRSSSGGEAAPTRRGLLAGLAGLAAGAIGAGGHQRGERVRWVGHFR